MLRRDRLLRVLTYALLAVVCVLLALWVSGALPRGGIWPMVGCTLLYLAVCTALWFNLRCPCCGRRLTDFQAVVFHRPKRCVHCGAAVSADGQNASAPDAGAGEDADELRARCREIARRDRTYRPLMWAGLALMIVGIIVTELDSFVLSETARVCVLIPACVFGVVTTVLWSRNLRCPACGRRLTGRYTPHRISGLWLPDAHVCGHCGAHLVFRESA
ncbi:MAG: hypothetical protein ACI4PD_05775 [Butyricicoccus sp.]